MKFKQLTISAGILLAALFVVGVFLFSKSLKDARRIKQPLARVEVQDQGGSSAQFTVVKDAEASASLANNVVEPEPDHNRVSVRLNDQKHETVWQATERLGLAEWQDRELYMTYPVEALKEMGENGDILALRALGDIYYQDGKIEPADQALEKAAVFGSTQALLALGTTMVNLAEGMAMGGDEFSPEIRNKLLEGMAWLKVGIQRGESYASERFDEFVAKRSLNLTDDDLNVIDTKAQAFYNRLIRERQRRGLGEFDQ